jgi:hypothetical protein
MRSEGKPMSDWQPAAYQDYGWIVANPQLLGGKLAIRGTRLSFSLIRECLAGVLVVVGFPCDTAGNGVVLAEALMGLWEELGALRFGKAGGLHCGKLTAG